MINFRYVIDFIPDMLTSLGMNVLVSLIAFILGIFVGLAAYCGKVSRMKPLSFLCISYIEVIRNTPLLVQLYLIYFGIAQFGIDRTPFETTIIALTLNCGAYCSEIFRAGFKAVPAGQLEAGKAIGMNRVQVFFHIELLQALRSSFPALINQYVMMFLGSSIAYVISLNELTYITMNINSFTARSVEIFTITGLMFYIVSFIAIRLLHWEERKLFKW